MRGQAFLIRRSDAQLPAVAVTTAPTNHVSPTATIVVACGNEFSGYQKRVRGRRGGDVRVGKHSQVGAIELALQNAPTRSTQHILEPVRGTEFDSLAEAYEYIHGRSDSG